MPITAAFIFVATKGDPVKRRARIKTEELLTATVFSLLGAEALIKEPTGMEGAMKLRGGFGREDAAGVKKACGQKIPAIGFDARLAPWL